MSDPFDPNTTQQVIESKTETRYSRSTLANLNDAAEKLTETKKSMLDDMSRGVFQTPQDALDAIMKLQDIQSRIGTLKHEVEEKTAPGFSAKDVETIEEMKRQGKSEERIAALFGTNQTKINRLRNGKAPLDEA